MQHLLGTTSYATPRAVPSPLHRIPRCSMCRRNALFFFLVILSPRLGRFWRTARLRNWLSELKGGTVYGYSRTTALNQGWAGAPWTPVVYDDRCATRYTLSKGCS